MAILVLTHEGLTLKTIPIDTPELSIGRHSDSDIYIDDKLVSQHHALIEMKQHPASKDKMEYYIEDLGSTNYTYVNDEKIVRKKLRHEDHIRIGSHVFKFIDENVSVGEKTTKLQKSWTPGVYYTKE